MSTAIRQPNSQGQTALPYFVIAFLGLALKSVGALSMPQFWAEDATIFFQGQFGKAMPQLFVPYAGYYHAIPRVVAWLASLGSPTKAPLIYNVFATTLGAASIAYCAARLRRMVPPALVLASFLLVPINGEVLGTITNAQWFLQFPLAICCFSPRSNLSGWRACVALAAVLLMALTGPFSILVAIVSLTVMSASFVAQRRGSTLFDGYLASWNVTRDRRFILATALGAAVQAATLLFNIIPQSKTHPGLVDQLDVCFLNLVPLHVFGFDFMRGKLWLLFYAFIIGSLLLHQRIRGDYRLVLLAMVSYAAIETFAPMGLKEVEQMYQFGFADRYFYVTKVVFWWATFGTFALYTSRREAAALTLVMLTLIALMNPGRLQRQAFVNLEWKKHARELAAPGVHVVPVNPVGWAIVVETPKRN